jgi:putative FmdB family regulatory protein
MPLYDYHCDGCDRGKQEMRLMAEREDAPTCDQCGEQMKLQISAVRGVVKNPAVPRESK